MSFFKRFLNLFQREPPLRRADPAQTGPAMTYATTVIGRPPPVRVEWFVMPVKERINGVWTHTGAGARTQFFPDRTRIVVYVGPNGEAQSHYVFDHEAAHAILRENHHDPRWRGKFKNWYD